MWNPSFETGNQGLVTFQTLHCPYEHGWTKSFPDDPVHLHTCHCHNAELHRYLLKVVAASCDRNCAREIKSANWILCLSQTMMVPEWSSSHSQVRPGPWRCKSWTRAHPYEHPKSHWRCVFCSTIEACIAKSQSSWGSHPSPLEDQDYAITWRCTISIM